MGTECSSERIQAVNSGIHEVLKILPVSIYTGEIRDALFYTLLLANSYKKLLPIRSSHLPKSQRRLKKFSVSTDENIIPLKIDETHFVIPGIEDSIEKTRNELDKILLNMHNAFRDRGRADINQRTTLHFAAYWGSPVCVQTLILEKADVDAQDKYGLNPAMWACQADRLDNLLLLEQVKQNPIKHDLYVAEMFYTELSKTQTRNSSVKQANCVHSAPVHHVLIEDYCVSLRKRSAGGLDLSE
ncbi:unnamed protein product [Calicophoron daubneyi]|uniref:ANK_REP_REGION domain-containing protein n=1 Tax=Calicophoron daubneyi TaxID=300641 RepID=A0AAV2TF61_CALDB